MKKVVEGLVPSDDGFVGGHLPPPRCMLCSREYKSCYLMWLYTKGVRGCWPELTELLTAYTTIPPCVVLTGKRSSTVGDSEIWSTHKESLYPTWCRSEFTCSRLYLLPWYRPFVHAHLIWTDLWCRTAVKHTTDECCRMRLENITYYVCIASFPGSPTPEWG